MDASLLQQREFMEAQSPFAALKEYFESKPACHTALRPLRKGAEIGVLIGGSIEASITKGEDGNPLVENRPAQNPDFIFLVSSDALATLLANPGENVGQVGILIGKEILAGSIQVKFPGGLLGVLRNGYLDIMQLGGEDFLNFLKTQGFTSLNKVLELLKNLKK